MKKQTVAAGLSAAGAAPGGAAARRRGLCARVLRNLFGAVPVEFLLQMEGLTTATVGDLSTDDQRDIVRSFGDIVLVSWNLADEKGNDIPADADGVLSLDSEVFNAVIDAWKDYLVGDKNLDSAQPEQPASV